MAIGLIDRLRATAKAARRAWAGKSERAYKGAEVNRLVEDWIATVLQPDDETRWSLRRLRARSRELSRNNPYMRGYRHSLGINVLGVSGPVLQAQVRNNPAAGETQGQLNKRINDRIEAAWTDWSRSPTTDGRLTLTRFQHLALKTVATDGEVFVRKRVGFDGNPYRFALEMIDADLLDENYSEPGGGGRNEIRMGVEVDPTYGRPVAYHFFKRPPSMGSYVLDRYRVPAEEIIHLYDPDRANQTRGVPWAVSVMWPLKMLEGYMESTAVAARLGASAMGFWTRKKDETVVGEVVPDPETGNITMDAAPGTFEFAPDGYELANWDPKQPNAQYDTFVKSKLREAATGLGIDYNSFANDLENVNYSSMRSGLLVARERWRELQDWWISSFLCPVYEEWLDAALLSGALVLDSRNYQKFLAYKFFPRGWPWVDPEKDGKAGVIGIQTGLDSRTRLLAEKGLDLETVLEDLKREQEMAAEYGVDISGPPAAAPFGGGGGGDQTTQGNAVDPTGRRNGHVRATAGRS